VPQQARRGPRGRHRLRGRPHVGGLARARTCRRLRSADLPVGSRRRGRRRIRVRQRVQHRRPRGRVRTRPIVDVAPLSPAESERLQTTADGSPPAGVRGRRFTSRQPDSAVAGQWGFVRQDGAPLFVSTATASLHGPLSPGKRLVQPVGGFSLLYGRDVAVDGVGGVPEVLVHDLGVGAGGQQQARRRVPDRMEVDTGEARPHGE
jgi:hypothetical protein